MEFAPKEPLFAYAYIQDRFELEDLVLNIGLRMDYFDTKTDILKDPIVDVTGMMYFYHLPEEPILTILIRVIL